MPDYYKCSFQMNTPQRQGYTINLVLPSTTFPAVSAGGIIDRMAQKILAMVCNKYSLYAVRISKRGNARTSRRALYWTSASPSGAAGTLPGEPVSDKLAVWLQFTNFDTNGNLMGRMLRPFHGFNKSCIDANGSFFGHTTWVTAWQNLQAQLIADGWGWFGRAGFFSVPITTVVAQPDETVKVTTQLTVTPPLNVGDKFQARFSGIRGASALNGVRDCKVNTGVEIQTLRPVAILPYQGPSGKVSGGTSGFLAVQPNVNTWTGMSEHKTGAPFGVFRGRRRALARS